MLAGYLLFQESNYLFICVIRLLNLFFSSILYIWYVEVRITRSIQSPLDFEITRIDCIRKYRKAVFRYLPNFSHVIRVIFKTSLYSPLFLENHLSFWKANAYLLTTTLLEEKGNIQFSENREFINDNQRAVSKWHSVTCQIAYGQLHMLLLFSGPSCSKRR